MILLWWMSGTKYFCCCNFLGWLTIHFGDNSVRTTTISSISTMCFLFSFSLIQSPQSSSVTFIYHFSLSYVRIARAIANIPHFNNVSETIWKCTYLQVNEHDTKWIQKKNFALAITKRMFRISYTSREYDHRVTKEREREMGELLYILFLSVDLK